MSKELEQKLKEQAREIADDVVNKNTDELTTGRKLQLHSAASRAALEAIHLKQKELDELKAGAERDLETLWGLRTVVTEKDEEIAELKERCERLEQALMGSKARFITIEDECEFPDSVRLYAHTGVRVIRQALTETKGGEV